MLLVLQTSNVRGVVALLLSVQHDWCIVAFMIYVWMKENRGLTSLCSGKKEESGRIKAMFPFLSFYVSPFETNTFDSCM